MDITPVLVLLLVLVAGATPCPAPAPYCECAFYDADTLRSITCGGPNMTDLPAFDVVTNLPVPSLIIKDSPFTTIEAGAFSTISIRTLTVEYTQLQVIQKSAFTGQDYTLESIIIKDNPLLVIYTDVFKDLEKLRVLQIESNVLELIEHDAFWNLPSLSYLSLHGNQLTSVPHSWFGRLPKLDTLVLEANLITDVHVDAFRLLPALVYLSLTSNSLTSAPRVPSTVTHIALAHNQISVLPSGMLRDARELTRLDLQDNRLTVLPSDLLFYTRALRQLDLSYNRLTALDSFPFRGLGDLQLIKLNGNRLSRIPSHVFEDQEGVKELHVEYNRISVLENNCMVGLYSLDALYISNNNISSFPFGLFDPLGSLKTVDASHNRISSLGSEPFISNGYIQSINLSSNRIREVKKDWFEKQAELRHLDLSHNRIYKLDDDTFTPLTSLEQLFLHNNRIHKPSKELLSGNPGLLNLTLHTNPLAEVPEFFFRQLNKVRELDLSKTCLTSLKYRTFATSRTPGILKLSLRYNNIEAVTVGALGGLENVTEVDLSHNLISSLSPGALRPLASIQKLDLANNKLTWKSVEDQLRQLASLSWLDLSSNQLTYVAREALDPLPLLGALYLQDNPINCASCDSAWLRGASVIADIDKVECASKSELAACFNETALNCSMAPVTLTVAELCEKNMAFVEANATELWKDNNFCTPDTDEVVSPTSFQNNPARISILRSDGDEVFLRWLLFQHDVAIKGFRVTYRVDSANYSDATAIIDATEREATLDRGIEHDRRYIVCLDVVLANYVELHFPGDCRPVVTLKEVAAFEDFVVPRELPILTIIIVCSVAGFIIILIVILISVCAYKIRKKQNTQDPYASDRVYVGFNYGEGIDEQLAEDGYVEWDVFASIKDVSRVKKSNQSVLTEFSKASSSTTDSSAANSDEPLRL